jgi:hypothetical protein
MKKMNWLFNAAAFVMIYFRMHERSLIVFGGNDSVADHSILDCTLFHISLLFGNTIFIISRTADSDLLLKESN